MTEETRFDLKQKEIAFLAGEQKRRPDLFSLKSHVDDEEFLDKLGIYIPGKETLPNAFLKYRPEDFIVEEIDINGEIHDVSTNEKAFNNADGQTVFATLVKCGLSTIEAQEDIASAMKIRTEQIQYSGIKDKDALTSQKISFRGISAANITKVSSPYLFIKNIHTGKGVAEKGGLKGNRFTILLRVGQDLSNKEKMSALIKALEKVREGGFYNFYYIQRFGNPRLNNFYWGIHLLNGNYEKAVKGYITDVGIRETPYFKEKREEMLNALPDWNKVLDIMKDLPVIFSNEIKVAKYLIAKPNDYIGAMKTISDQVSFWVYGLSAYLFNRQISSYLKAGMEPPKELPLFLSKDKNDWLPYSDDLERFGLFPLSFEPLRFFPKIQTAGVRVKTKDQVQIHSADIINEGIIVEFSLGKGEYATTFLSHIVNLISGETPKDILDEKIDTYAKIGKGSLAETFKYFASVSNSKRDLERGK